MAKTTAAVDSRNIIPLGYPETIPADVARNVHAFMGSILLDRDVALSDENKQHMRERIATSCKPHVKHIMFSTHHKEAIILTLKDGSVFWATTSDNQHIPADAIAFLKSCGTRNHTNVYMKRILQLAPFVDLDVLSYEKKGKLQAYAHHSFIKHPNEKYLKKFLARFDWQKVKSDRHRLTDGEVTYFMDYNMGMHEKFPQQELEIANHLAEGKQHWQELVKRADIAFAQKYRAERKAITAQLTDFIGSNNQLNEYKQMLLRNAYATLQQARSDSLQHAHDALTKARRLSFTMGKMHSLNNARRLAAQIGDAISLLSRTIQNAEGKEAHLRKVEQDAQAKQQQQQHELAKINKARHAGVLEIESLAKRTHAMLVSLRSISSNPFDEIKKRLEAVTADAQNATSYHEISTANVSAKQVYLDALAWTQSLSVETAVAAA